MSDPVSIAKDALAEVKTAVVHTPGMLESLVSKVEAAFAHLEAQAAGAVSVAETEVETVVAEVEGKDAKPAADKDAPVPGAADDEPKAVKEVADGDK